MNVETRKGSHTFKEAAGRARFASLTPPDATSTIPAGFLPSFLRVAGNDAFRLR
jgi:hypothetical protein